MKKAQYPQRTCREPVAGPNQDYPCEVREWHPGPHASLSVPDSVKKRNAWEAANPGWEKVTAFDDPFKDLTREHAAEEAAAAGEAEGGRPDPL